MTDAEREYELEQAVRTLGACMKDLRRFEQWPEPTPAETVYLAGLRLQIAEAKQRVVAMLAGEAWQPIETAPKDGSHVLIYRPVTQLVGYYATGRGVWCVNAPGLPILAPPPTHWMPLPPAPESREAS